MCYFSWWHIYDLRFIDERFSGFIRLDMDFVPEEERIFLFIKNVVNRTNKREYTVALSTIFPCTSLFNGLDIR